MDIISGGIFFMALTGLSFNMGADQAVTEACYSEPLRLVYQQKDTYNSVVSGCEYQANKSKYTVIKAL